MKRSNNVAVVTVAAISLAIGCSSRDEQTSAVCVDGSNRVVARETCESNRSGGYFWYYHAAYAGASYPRVGTPVRSGGTIMQAGQVSRGGFGGTARARSSAT